MFLITSSRICLIVKRSIMNEFINRYTDEVVEAVLVYLTGLLLKNFFIRMWKKIVGPYFEKWIYKEAAKNEPLKNVNSSYQNFSIIISLLILFIGFEICKEISELSKEAEMKEHMILTNKVLKVCNECRPLKVMRNTKDIQFELFKLKISGVIIIAVSCSVILFNFCKITRRYMCYDWQIKFNQDLNRIRPYIEDKEFHELNSMWACMENHEHFQAIQNRINKIMDVLKKNKRE